MTKQARMDWTSYNEIAKDQACAWEKNVVMLRKAIQYIDDDKDTLWSRVLPLLPCVRPQSNNGCLLPGTEVILIVRQFISKRYKTNQRPLDAFWQTETDLFEKTAKYEAAIKDRTGKTPLGYAEDGFLYRNGIMRVEDKALKYIGAFCSIGDFDPALTTGWYINGVDHFYTKLIWNVVSGLSSTIFDLKVSGLYYSLADVLEPYIKGEIPANEPDYRELSTLLKTPYNDMLEAEAEKARNA